MIHKLPRAFTEKMKSQLGDEFFPFIQTYNQPRTHGLRLNTLKITPEHGLFSKLKELFLLRPVPWCPEGYYYEEDIRPGKHPYHAAGLYYIQEPSAMSAVEILNPLPGDIVLDLAAAPGGKSTHIAQKLKGKGLLIANEIHPKRAVALSENIERMGISNTVVTVASPEQLSQRFPRYFDKILLDAPCSGEGMFRKDPDMIAHWSPKYVQTCSSLQKKILEYSARMLKPGGMLAYSTCTFSKEENEDVIAWFLDQHSEFFVLRMERIWPHRQEGEGHFVALLRKMEDEQAVPFEKGGMLQKRKNKRNAKGEKNAREAYERFIQFCQEAAPGFEPEEGEPVLFGEQLYWLPHGNGRLGAECLEGLRVLRPGLHLAEVKKNRVEPSHALALYLGENGVNQQVSFSPESEELYKYLRGETLVKQGIRGWCAVGVDGFLLGWAKGTDGILKNHYPKGLRWIG